MRSDIGTFQCKGNRINGHVDKFEFKIRITIIFAYG